MPKYRKGLGDDTERYIRHEYGYIEYRYAPANTCEIVNIEVIAEHRGQGVGRRLLEDLFERIQDKTDRVYAITRTDNEIAQAFYERTGFSVFGVLRRFYSSHIGVDAIMYGRSAKGPV